MTIQKPNWASTGRPSGGQHLAWSQMAEEAIDALIDRPAGGSAPAAERVQTLAAGSIVSSAAPSTWPIGLSMMPVAGAAGYPAAIGLVVSERPTATRTAQRFLADNGAVWVRWAVGSAGWQQQWRRIDAVEQPDTGWVNATMGVTYSGGAIQVRRVGKMVTIQSEYFEVTGSYPPETMLGTMPLGFRPTRNLPVTAIRFRSGSAGFAPVGVVPQQGTIVAWFAIEPGDVVDIAGCWVTDDPWPS